MKEVKFVFDSEEAAKHFLSWLCGSGEQSYWDWMSCQGGESAYTVDFDYHGGTRDGKEFGKHSVICKSRGQEEKDRKAEESC